MGAFSFLTGKPATKLTTNLYLGDKNHVPNDADFIVVCSRELLNAFVKLHQKKNEPQANIVYDPDNHRIFCRFVDWARWRQVDVSTSVRVLKIIDKQLEAGKKVYVHCMYGVNRSASHCFMYLVGKKIINEPTFKKAMKAFKKIYPGINPLFGWKKLLIYYYPYHDFFSDNIEVLDKKTAIAKWKKEKWLAKVRIKAKRKEERARAKNIY